MTRTTCPTSPVRRRGARGGSTWCSESVYRNPNVSPNTKRQLWEQDPNICHTEECQRARLAAGIEYHGLDPIGAAAAARAAARVHADSGGAEDKDSGCPAASTMAQPDAHLLSQHQ